MTRSKIDQKYNRRAEASHTCSSSFETGSKTQTDGLLPRLPPPPHSAKRSIMTLFSTTVGHKQNCINKLVGFSPPSHQSHMLCGSEPAPLVRSLSDFQQDWACARLDSLLPETKPSTRGTAPKTQFSHISAFLYWAAAPLCSIAKMWLKIWQIVCCFFTKTIRILLVDQYFYSGLKFCTKKHSTSFQCMERIGRKEPLKFILKCWDQIGLL